MPDNAARNTGIFSREVVWIVGAALVIGLGLLALMASDLILIALTSIAGAILVMSGIDCYARTGFNVLLALPPPTTDFVILLAATCILAAFGFLFQVSCFPIKRRQY